MTKESYVNAYVDGEQVVLLQRVDGKLRERRVAAEYVTYYLLDDIPIDLGRSLRTSENVLGMTREKQWLRVQWKRPFKRGKGDWEFDPRRFMYQDENSPFNKLNIQSYEGDVHPVLRHFIDSGCGIARPRSVYLDLETDSRVSFAQKEQMRILCWCLVDEDGNEHMGVLTEDTDEAEKKLLEELWKHLAAYDQVRAWNGDRFDFPVLFARSQDRGIDVNVDRWLWLDHLMVFKRMNVTASESGDEKTSMKLQDVAMSLLGEGKDDFDASKTYQEWAAGGERRERMRVYCLQDTRLLGKIEKKTGYLELFFTLCESCGIFPDSPSTNPTHQVDGFMLRLGKAEHLHFKTRKYGEDVEQFAGAYVMEPTYKGICRDVHVGDFARLYPSIIVTWNMSPETKVGVYDHQTKLVTTVSGSKVAMRDEWCRAPRTNVVFDTSKRGVLVTALLEMIRLRAFWNEKKASLTPGTPEWSDADRRSTAYKIAANSFFGVVSSPFSRYYDKQVGESITQSGVFLIQATIDEGKKFTPSVNTGYADTDSTFADRVTKEEFEQFVKHCNANLYPALTKAHGCRAYDIKLAYEKQFDRIVFTGKKRYAGRYKHYKGKEAKQDSKPEIKGLEFKRGDTAKLARELQEKCIRLLLGDWEEPYTPATEDIAHYHDLVASMQRRILEEPIAAELCVIAKSINKKLPPTQREIDEHLAKQKERAEKKGQEWTEKDAALALDVFMHNHAGDEGFKARKKQDGSRMAYPPQVQVALILKERGEEVHVGSKIGYVVTDGSKSPMEIIPASDFNGTNLDRYYLWENLVWPPTERLLEAAFPNHDWRSWGKVRPKKQRARKATTGPREVHNPNEPVAPWEGGPSLEDRVARLEENALAGDRKAPDAPATPTPVSAAKTRQRGAQRAVPMVPAQPPAEAIVEPNQVIVPRRRSVVVQQGEAHANTVTTAPPTAQGNRPGEARRVDERAERAGRASARSAGEAGRGDGAQAVPEQRDRTEDDESIAPYGWTVQCEDKKGNRWRHTSGTRADADECAAQVRKFHPDVKIEVLPSERPSGRRRKHIEPEDVAPTEQIIVSRNNAPTPQPVVKPVNVWVIDCAKLSPQRLDELKEVLRQYPGHTPVHIQVKHAKGHAIKVDLRVTVKRSEKLEAVAQSLLN